MSINYEIISDDSIICIKDLCNELMSYQKSKSYIHSDLFDSMSFETRMIPSVKSADANFILVAKDDNEIVGYVYSNISLKETYSNKFATFIDLDSVENDKVDCLSQFYIKEGYLILALVSVLWKSLWIG